MRIDGCVRVGAVAAIAAGLCFAQGRTGAPLGARAKAAGLTPTFEENLGQTDAAARFVARGNGATLWLADREAVLALAGTSAQDVLRMAYVGASDVRPSGSEEAATRSNYLRGEGGNVVGARHFGRVVSDDLWPGVDLAWHSAPGKAEYDLVVAPGADVSAARIALAGPDSLELRDGDLVMRFGDREVVQSAPVAYQMNGAAREPVASAFELRGNEVGFRVGAYDAGRELIVDPSIDFSTFLGGSGDESGQGVAVDPISGKIVLTGGTSSIDFPLGFGHIPTAPKGLTDAYVVKLNAAATFIEWATYVAGGDYDEAFDVGIDPSNQNIWITGQTFSSNFPTLNPTQALRAGGWDGFVTEINPTGDFLLFSTYVGGSGDDYPRALTMGSAVTIAGFTTNNTYPTVGAVQPAFGGGPHDAFVTTWSRTTPHVGIVRSTFLGGMGDDRAYDVTSFTGTPANGQPGTVDVITNGSFETGLFSPWTTTDLAFPNEPINVRVVGYTPPAPGNFFATSPSLGSFAVVSGFGGTNGGGSNDITLEQTVTLPATTDLCAATFDWRSAWNFVGVNRTAKVQFRSGDGVTLLHEETFHTAVRSLGSAQDVDFDAAGFGPLSGPYGGPTWFLPNNVILADATYPSHAGHANVLQTDGAVLRFTFPAPVVFDGAWISGTGMGNKWELRLGGVLVHTSGTQDAKTFALGGPEFFSSGYSGAVDDVRFINDDSFDFFLNDVALDDITLRNGATATAGPSSYTTSSVDLSTYAGSTVRLRFVLTVPDASVNTGHAQFQLDNVHCYAAKGNVVVAGRTTSSDFPRINNFNATGKTIQAAPGGSADAFVTQYRRNVTALNWSTTYGGSGEDEARGVAVLPGGNVAFTGNTNSFDFPRVLALQATRRGPDDAFLVATANGASTLEVSRYLGGAGSDTGRRIEYNSTTGDMYVLGITDSLDFPSTIDALQAGPGGNQGVDAFVVRFGTVVNTFGIEQPGFVKYASCFGGTGTESGNGLTLLSGSTMYIAGTSSSPVGMPLIGAVQSALNGSTDAFVAKLNVATTMFPARELVAEARSPETVELSWKSEPTEATALEIERTAENGDKTLIATVSTSTTSYLDTGLTPDTTYSYTVVAVESDGTKDAPNFVQTLTPPFPPAAPTGLEVATFGAKAVLDWNDASSDETGFEVQRATAGAPLRTIATLPAGTRHYETAPMVASETTANWRVVAVNRGGRSASNVVSATTSPSLVVEVKAGSLVDSVKSRADRFAASGRLSGTFDPDAQELRIEFGDASSPIALRIPAGDRGWKQAKSRLSWTSSRSFLGGAKFQLDLNTAKGTFSLNVSGFDFPAAPANPVSVGFGFGGDAGAARVNWAAKQGGKLVLK